MELDYSLVIEATEDPTFFGLYSEVGIDRFLNERHNCA